MYNNPPNNFSPRHSQIPSLFSHYLHNPTFPEDTIFVNSTNNSPIHNVWQSTKKYSLTTSHIKFHDIPLTSINILFIQPERPVKTYSYCCFPLNKFMFLSLHKFHNFSFTLFIVQLLFHNSKALFCFSKLPLNN